MSSTSDDWAFSRFTSNRNSRNIELVCNVRRLCIYHVEGFGIFPHIFKSWNTMYLQSYSIVWVWVRVCAHLQLILYSFKTDLHYLHFTLLCAGSFVYIFILGVKCKGGA
jgi:hypothetical protein